MFHIQSQRGKDVVVRQGNLVIPGSEEEERKEGEVCGKEDEKESDCVGVC